MLIPCGDVKNRTVRYTTGDDCNGLTFYSSGHRIEIMCSSCRRQETVLYGTGRLQILCGGEPQIQEAEFTLMVRETGCKGLKFRMQILSCPSNFEHDSGFVDVKEYSSDLRSGAC